LAATPLAARLVFLHDVDGRHFRGVWSSTLNFVHTARGTEI